MNWHGTVMILQRNPIVVSYPKAPQKVFKIQYTLPERWNAWGQMVRPLIICRWTVKFARK